MRWLYLEAGRLFWFVGVEEYVSNALGELGYAVLEVELPELDGALDNRILKAGGLDLARDVQRVFDPSHALEINRPPSAEFARR